MASIQSRLQSRIAKRAAEITELELKRSSAKCIKNWLAVAAYNNALKHLREDQTLDKDFMRKTNWGGA